MSSKQSTSATADAPIGRGGRRGVKRPFALTKDTSKQPPAAEVQVSGECFNCVICRQTFTEPQVTPCGHTYCKDCIIKHLGVSVSKNCPSCGQRVNKEDLVFNFALNEIIQMQRSKQIKLEHDRVLVSVNGVSSNLKGPIATAFQDLSLSDIDLCMALLKRKRDTLVTESTVQQKMLTLSFLQELERKKRAQKKAIEQELDLIGHDIAHESAALPKSPSIDSGAVSGDDSNPSSPGFSNAESVRPKFFDISSTVEQSALPNMRKRMTEHFDELIPIYFDSRNVELFDRRNNDARVPTEDSVSYESLETFGETLARISKFHRLEQLATLSYSADLLSSSNIVSSIEFDKDSEFFAIAGVTKKIKLFEYTTVVGSNIDIHCPSSELTCNAKISCVAWSSYYKNYLASSDYEGCVTLWDSRTSQKTRGFNEHEKRVWSVDWSNGDPRLLASGSDDTKVKLWSTNQDRSVAQLEAKANVCCVKFCSKNTYNIAFGSADHCVHYYDFRSPREPLGILEGHKKAVSYVKFASNDELVSASTDSQLKLWDMNELRCTRSFKGHVNEKNFVGLATDGSYIACGSENNSLYVYYKALPKPLFSYKFDSHRSMVDRPRNDDSSEFVSAVAWKKGSDVVVAANSQGNIKILELK